MAPPKTYLNICILLLLTVTLTLAQPWSHRAIPKEHLHQLKHEALSEPRDSTSKIKETGDDVLIVDHESKLALQNAILNRIGHSESSSSSLELGADFTSRSPNKRQANNEQLSQKLNELNAALQSLVQLLALDYGVAPPASSSTAAAFATTTTLPGSIVAAPTTTNNATSGPLATTTVAAATSTAAGAASPFDPTSRSNTAVYYSQTDQTSHVSLSQICSNPNIDIVILAFVNTLFSGPSHTGWPALNLGSNCWAASANQTAAGATSLIDCVSDGFADQIAQCQALGKKVMLSVGGAAGYSDTTIPSDEKAFEVAGTLWDLFLGGGTRNGRSNETAEVIRPFGDVVLDGIDIDNESGSTLHLSTLMTTLRAFFPTDPSHRYFLSAAPQCPRPDASIPLSAMQTQADFIFVQFYNNPSCNLDSNASFLDSLTAWSNDLDGVQQMEIAGENVGGFKDVGNGVSSPRVFVGAPAFAAAGSGFVEGAQFRSIMESVKGLELPNLGGVMWWDGAYEYESAGVDGVGESYSTIAKEVLD